MDWIKLFNCERLGVSENTDTLNADRTSFQRDFDRIVFSSAFRRLQSKTQVFPLPKADFIHTRLTHSLETSCVGRSLGSLVGRQILENNKELEKHGITCDVFAAVVANACLAHDIGNPPFGHSGEDAISGYFRSDRAKIFLEGLTDAQIADFQNFEGNALGFRILTHTLPRQSKLTGGLGLTFATLATFAKYPRGSVTHPFISSKEGSCEGEPHTSPKRLCGIEFDSSPKNLSDREAKKTTTENNKTDSVCEKKFGFFDSEKSTFEKVASKTELIHKEGRAAWFRHPLAFLVEAADDICYRIMDLEDGVKLNLISFKEAEELLLELLEKANWDSNKYEGVIDKREKLNYLRAKTISALIAWVAESFMQNYDSLMKGKFTYSLIDTTPAKPVLDKIQKVSIKKIYNYRKVIEIESAGFEVLSGLLDLFLNAVLGEKTDRNKCNIKLVPEQFLPFDEQLKTGEGRYEAIMNIIQFISGMTDTYAMDTYKSLKGISLPVY